VEQIKNALVGIYKQMKVREGRVEKKEYKHEIKINTMKGKCYGTVEREKQNMKYHFF
jgi:hypothetical protein